VFKEVLPSCMAVPFVPCDFDGRRLGPDIGPYFLGVGLDVYEAWGVKMKSDRLQELGLPVEMAG
jgi:hypothetical protein